MLSWCTGSCSQPGLTALQVVLMLEMAAVWSHCIINVLFGTFLGCADSDCDVAYHITLLFLRLCSSYERCWFTPPCNVLTAQASVMICRQGEAHSLAQDGPTLTQSQQQSQHQALHPAAESQISDDSLASGGAPPVPVKRPRTGGTNSRVPQGGVTSSWLQALMTSTGLR